jgi:Sec-independent protein secretion pathway component TatC
MSFSYPTPHLFCISKSFFFKILIPFTINKIIVDKNAYEIDITVNINSKYITFNLFILFLHCLVFHRLPTRNKYE